MSCKGCTKRVLNCHSICPDYLDNLKKQKELKEKQKLEMEVYDYIHSTGRMNREKRQKKLNLPKK